MMSATVTWKKKNLLGFQCNASEQLRVLQVLSAFQMALMWMWSNGAEQRQGGILLCSGCVCGHEFVPVFVYMESQKSGGGPNQRGCNTVGETVFRIAQCWVIFWIV